jgi:Uma2 family endonuclease
MAEPAERLKVTPEAYLAYERGSVDAKHEFVDGEIFAMSGGTFEHAMIAGNVLTELQSVLRDRPCRVLGSDLRVGAADQSYHYPDASVVCDKPRFKDETRDVLLNPSLIVEVLSDSTEGYDRGDKFAHYRTIESLRDYVLISQRVVLVEHFHRLASGEWRFRALGPGAQLELEDHACAIAVERLYLKVFDEATATPAG